MNRSKEAIKVFIILKIYELMCGVWWLSVGALISWAVGTAMFNFFFQEDGVTLVEVTYIGFAVSFAVGVFCYLVVDMTTYWIKNNWEKANGVVSRRQREPETK